MINDSLEEYYRMNFNMKEYYSYSITELEQMLPWERLIYAMQVKELDTKRETERKNAR
ncbi:baseplate hub assembly catalyst [Paraglaciecola Antarctic GD virus 1]|nr:baseplate hub assembly catalyst [Paraglaciecola Antarctic GD virus 1]